MSVLRPMMWTDIPELVEMDRAAFADDAWAAASWWQELAQRPHREYLILERDGEIAAYGGIHHGGKTADLMTIAVAPQARSAGLGALLLMHLQRLAAARGAQAMLLEVRADNEAARSMYQRAGYAVIGARRGYYQPDGIDALVMRKLLDPATDADTIES